MAWELGCCVAVVEIDASEDLHGSNKIPGISLLYNCKYEDNGIRVWKAYNIGGGELLTNKDLPVQQQDIVRLTVKQPFGHRTKERGVIGETVISRSQTGIFPCNDSTCVLTFKTERGSEAHMDWGKHVKELETVSLYDTVRLKFAECVTGISDAVLSKLHSDVQHGMGTKSNEEKTWPRWKGQGISSWEIWSRGKKRNQGGSSLSIKRNEIS